MRDFALAPEIEELRSAAERLGRSELEPRVRESEAAGRWPDAVLEVLDGFPLGGLDVPEARGGVGAGALAKVVLLETLAQYDASGLPAADRPGPAVGAILACPDRSLAAEVLATALDGTAQSALTVVDVDNGSRRLDWAPGWPALRWIWVSEGDGLRLYEVTGTPDPVVALAFQASGGVSIPFRETVVRGAWHLEPNVALEVRGRARLWGAAVCVGVAQAALEETIEYTTARVVFGKPVAHHQGNAFDLAYAGSRVHAARLMVRDAAAAFDRGEEFAAFWATQSWLETREAAFVATNVGIQLLGGHGFIVDHLAEKRFREVRHLAMAAGGLDAAEFDVASQVLHVPDGLLAGLDQLTGLEKR
ncbi:MAG: acyl-CoA dehydrogenase family protein [Actinomycetota bacterium]|nr:acyl-CoA dehydrogenase family protein [Actinomycetota bacterium]